MMKSNLVKSTSFAKWPIYHRRMSTRKNRLFQVVCQEKSVPRPDSVGIIGRPCLHVIIAIDGYTTISNFFLPCRSLRVKQYHHNCYGTDPNSLLCSKCILVDAVQQTPQDIDYLHLEYLNWNDEIERANQISLLSCHPQYFVDYFWLSDVT